MQAQRLRRGLYLEYLTLGWNVIGCLIVIRSAYLTGSVALAGFGLDSLIEIVASVVVVWQLRGVGQARERLALRLIGVAFLALALYIGAQSLHALLAQARPASSALGIGWLASTVVVMALLAWGKHRTGQQLGNVVLLTEARVTLVDAYLAAAVFVGIVASARLGWWWTDPLAGLVVVFYGIREGFHALRESAAGETV